MLIRQRLLVVLLASIIFCFQFQIQDVETAIDTREQSVPPTPEVNSSNVPPFQQLDAKGTSQTSPVLFINDRQTQLDGNYPLGIDIDIWS